MICHVGPGKPVPIALLAAAVRFNTMLGVLIAAVGVMPLSASGCGPTGWTAISLATVATYADGEYRPTLHVAAYSEPKNSIRVEPLPRHFGIVP